MDCALARTREGALRVDGKTIGYYSVASASIGLTLGAAKRREVIVFTTQESLNQGRPAQERQRPTGGSRLDQTRCLDHGAALLGVSLARDRFYNLAGNLQNPVTNRWIITVASSTVEPSPATIWTIGHSTRGLEEFLGLLVKFRIETLADVRSYPGSRRYPQYGKEALAASLKARAIEYSWLPALGGRRRAAPDSPNTAWRNAAFQGYADHMGTAEFAQGLQQLLELASRARAVVMCAEALWWRCHRSLIADVLSVRGIPVMHIMDAHHETLHPMTSAASIVRGELSYAGGSPGPRRGPRRSGSPQA